MTVAPETNKSAATAAAETVQKNALGDELKVAPAASGEKGPRTLDRDAKVQFTRNYYDGENIHKKGDIVDMQEGTIIPFSAKVLPPEKPAKTK